MTLVRGMEVEQRGSSPVQGQIKPLLELLAHEGHGALAEGRPHAARPAGLPQLVLQQRLDALILDQAVIALDLIQVAPQPGHLRCTMSHASCMQHQFV